MSKKRVNRSRPPMPQNDPQNYSNEQLEDMLERMKENRAAMVEEANRKIAQLDGAIGFVTQLLAGELVLPADEEESE
jgi:hypothetical protein